MALVYAALAKGSLIYFSGDGAVSILWPPAGFALAAVLLGGERYALSVFLGAALANGSDPNFSFWGALGMASANALEAFVGRRLMYGSGAFSNRLGQLRDYLRVMLMGGFVSAAVGALAGATVLRLIGAVNSVGFAENVLHWWMGDVLGIVLLTPLILVWRTLPAATLFSSRTPEMALAFMLAFMVGQTVHFSWFAATVGAVVGDYWMFLIVAWIAVRGGVHGVVLVLLMAAVQGMLGSYHGVGIFASDSLQPQQINFWFFLMLLSTVGVALAAHIAEHERLTSDLLRAKTRQDAMLNAIPDLLFEVDLEGRYYNVYTHQPESLVAPQAELLGSLIKDNLPPDAVHAVMASLQQANSQGFSAGRQIELELSQGRAWFELSVSPMETDAQAANPHFIVLSRDITARKLAEQDLRIAAIAFESQEGMFVADAEHVILRVNKAFSEVTGYSAEEVVGRHPRLFRSSEHGESFYAEALETVRRTGQWQGETWSRHKTGRLMSVWGTLTEVRDEQQRVTHYVRTLIDTTHRKLQEQQRLEREAQLRDTLVREVHHRIKNNLQGVTGVLRQSAQKYPESTDPINQAIAQVQSIAVIHGLQGRHVSGEILLQELVRAVAAGVQAIWHIDIAVDVGADFGDCLVAQTESVPLALVLNELLSNAVKHGGTQADVHVSLQKVAATSQLAGWARITLVNATDKALVPERSALSSRLSTGLELVAALLPPRGARLQQQAREGLFVSTLELEIPVIAWKAL